MSFFDERCRHDTSMKPAGPIVHQMIRHGSIPAMPEGGIDSGTRPDFDRRRIV
jgi:hypothetical protein